MQARGKLLGPVFPIADTAQNPRDHQSRFRGALIKMQIDRHRVLQMAEVGQSQAGRLCQLATRLAQRCQFGISGRDNDHIGGRLAQINGVFAILDGPRCGGEQMHQAVPA